jgi:hypothetical protein
MAYFFLRVILRAISLREITLASSKARVSRRMKIRAHAPDILTVLLVFALMDAHFSAIYDDVRMRKANEPRCESTARNRVIDTIDGLSSARKPIAVA